MTTIERTFEWVNVLKFGQALTDSMLCVVIEDGIT